MAETIRIEVVYALPGSQDIVNLDLAAGATLKTAIEASGLLQRHPEIVLVSAKCGIFSRVCTLDTLLRDLDRVEIYRPLVADPKEIRRQRASAGKAMKKGAPPAGKAAKAQ